MPNKSGVVGNLSLDDPSEPFTRRSAAYATRRVLRRIREALGDDPVFLPIVAKLPPEQIGWLGHIPPDKVAIWFGVTFCMNMQVSFLSPPFGPAAFYLKSVAPDDISLTDIFAGFIPFICIQLLALAVLLIYPPIVTVFL